MLTPAEGRSTGITAPVELQNLGFLDSGWPGLSLRSPGRDQDRGFEDSYAHPVMLSGWVVAAGFSLRRSLHPPQAEACGYNPTGQHHRVRV